MLLPNLIPLDFNLMASVCVAVVIFNMGRVPIRAAYVIWEVLCVLSSVNRLGLSRIWGMIFLHMRVHFARYSGELRTVKPLSFSFLFNAGEWNRSASSSVCTNILTMSSLVKERI